MGILIQGMNLDYPKDLPGTTIIGQYLIFIFKVMAVPLVARTYGMQTPPVHAVFSERNMREERDVLNLLHLSLFFENWSVILKCLLII